ncbi:hypothetical protein CAPTEDRAFT_225468 [Capitella teleta]|uniref:Amine oxidase domain-containing protein n=1 Tax=Capitella teleta TaxID=283909 RepID=R7TLL1_CAPTE|nr:hypothetical protein CAPTEDRAFT_225468 [Capitella teleta]|eukprot:ELT94559.1 hypothetical protein CAPTEDRAFT_225468 [Capitella teleta]
MAEESSDDSPSITMKTNPKVVIIGAGISGIMAGHELAKEGIQDFVILEATDRVGGRIWSVDLETAPGRKTELGANWIHGIHANPIYKIATQHNLLSKLYQGRKLGQRMMFLHQDGHPVNTKNDSVGAFIWREFSEKLDRYHGQERHIREMVLHQRLLGECIISGCNNMNDIALSEVGSFQELPGVHYVIPPGFEQICHILKENIPSEALRLKHAVSQIKYGQADGAEHPVCVECQNGQKFYADHVIVTVSLGYLKQHHDRLFEPLLPVEKLSAFERVAMGTVNKVILEFDGQILPDGIFRLELIWDRLEEDELVDLSERWFKKLGSFEAVTDNVLMGWLSGDEAEYMEKLSEEEVGKQCVDVLKRFLHRSVKELPNLKKVSRSTWKSNPFSLGAYSFIPVGAFAEDIETLAEPILDKDHTPTVLFAGEATHPNFYSSSHGALLSGKREAQRIIDLHHGGATNGDI